MLRSGWMFYILKLHEGMFDKFRGVSPCAYENPNGNSSIAPSRRQSNTRASSFIVDFDPFTLEAKILSMISDHRSVDSACFDENFEIYSIAPSNVVGRCSTTLAISGIQFFRSLVFVLIQHVLWIICKPAFRSSWLRHPLRMPSYGRRRKFLTFNCIYTQCKTFFESWLGIVS